MAAHFQLTFATTGGGRKSFRITNANTAVSENNVREAMGIIRNSLIFQTATGGLQSPQSARLVDITQKEFNVR